jgi:hypothetical protein
MQIKFSETSQKMPPFGAFVALEKRENKPLF